MLPLITTISSIIIDIISPTSDIGSTECSGIQSSVTCIIMGFFEGKDNHNNNVELCTNFFKPLQKFAGAKSSEEMFHMDNLYYTFKIAIVLDKKELQMCTETGGGTYTTKFPCTYTPIMNTQLRGPAPYRCKQFCCRWDNIDSNNAVNKCYHWDLMEKSEIDEYRSAEFAHIEAWVISFPKASDTLSKKRNFVVNRLKLSQHSKSSDVILRNIISQYKSETLQYDQLDTADLDKVDLNLMLRGFNEQLIEHHIQILTQSAEWNNIFLPNSNLLQLKRHLLRYVMFQAQKWEFSNQVSSESLVTQLAYMPENCPPCLMHCDIRVCGKLHTSFLQHVRDTTSNEVITELNFKINGILSKPDNPGDEMDYSFHRIFDDDIIKIEKQTVMDFKLTCKRMRKVISLCRHIFVCP